MPGRKYEVQSGYRYGFNGKEKDKDISAGDLDFGARIYDGRVGRWLSVDPLYAKYPNESHYAFVSNEPIIYADKDGKDKIITITVLNKDGTTMQLTKVDKNWFNYYKEARYGGAGYYYYKESLKVSLIIDNRKEGSITVEEAMKDPNMCQVSSEYIERTEVTRGEYLMDLLFSWVPSTGDESDKVRYGYHIYGNGKDLSWQDKLPIAADGSESLDLASFFKFLGALRPSAQPVDLLSQTKGSELVKKMLTSADEFRKAMVRAGAAYEIKVENEKEAQNNSKPPFQNNTMPRIEPGNNKPKHIFSGIKQGTIVHLRGSGTNSRVETDSTGTFEPEKPATDTVPKRRN